MSRYRVVETIGIGKIGTLYRAIDEKTGGLVAVKVTHLEWASDEGALRRIEMDVRAMLTLAEPAIVPILEVGRMADNRPYIVFQHVDGFSLEKVRLTEIALSAEEVLGLLEGMSGALDRAHKAGLVHRLLNPRKFLVARDPTSRRCRLVVSGFGLGALVGVPLTPSIRGAHAQQLIQYASAAYLAPEIAEGRRADHRSDVYSLATIAFELVSGARPFESATDEASLALKRFSKPPSLSDVAGFAFPRAIDEVFGRALSMEREDRYPSTGAFVAALHHAVLGSQQPIATADVADEIFHRVATMGDPPEVALDLRSEPPPRPFSPGDAGSEASASKKNEPEPMPTALAVRPVTRDSRGRIDDDAPPTPAVPSMEVVQRATWRVLGIASFCAVVVFLGAWFLVERWNRRVSENPHSEERSGPADVVAAERAGPQKDAAPSNGAQAAPNFSANLAAHARGVLAEAKQELAARHYPAAERLFREAAITEPTNPEPWLGLGQTYDAMGQHQDAIRAYGRFLTLDPNHSQASFVRARLETLVARD